MQKYFVLDKILSDKISGDKDAAKIEQISAFESFAAFRVRNINGLQNCSSEDYQILHVILLVNILQATKKRKMKEDMSDLTDMKVRFFLFNTVFVLPHGIY